ncbi:hypothetical protein L345_16722, partial [Ophiophagus hannah]
MATSVLSVKQGLIDHSEAFADRPVTPFILASTQKRVGSCSIAWRACFHPPRAPETFLEPLGGQKWHPMASRGSLEAGNRPVSDLLEAPGDPFFALPEPLHGCCTYLGSKMGHVETPWRGRGRRGQPQPTPGIRVKINVGQQSDARGPDPAPDVIGSAPCGCPSLLNVKRKDQANIASARSTQCKKERSGQCRFSSLWPSLSNAKRKHASSLGNGIKLVAPTQLATLSQLVVPTRSPKCQHVAPNNLVLHVKEKPSRKKKGVGFQ